MTSLAKRRGFVYPGSEIYGGLAGTWDYGPLGAELKRNIKNEFWKNMVQERENIVGVDAAIIMNPKVWEASGHLDSFSDPLVECKKCHHRFRADEVLVAPEGVNLGPTEHAFVVELKKGYRSPEKCPDCGGELTTPKQFNLMVETYLGAIEGEKLKTYLRGEITQGVHVNFKNVLDSTRVKLPFGIAQIGKAFRNEITPGDFTFRSREFEQMELQYYVKPDKKESMTSLEYWKEERMKWYESLGMKKKNLRFKEHEKLAHYAQAAFDIEYHVDGEWREMEGIHHRGDWDLRRHQEFSKQDLTYFDEETKERFLPFIIETSGGVDRATLFFLMDAYHEEKDRTVLRFHPKIAPYKAAVFPLLANKPQLVELAEKIYKDLKKEWMIAWDARGNIGKRYYSQDEIGTPYCVTVDFDSLETEDVTVRDRDTTKQERVKIKELKKYLAEKLSE
ncbi:glycine--tRNA ligase [bacterium]|nr:MAG: glycine--tRNA ligase [bacterium]